MTCDVVSYIFKRRRYGSNVSRRHTCATSSPRRYVEATLALTCTGSSHRRVSPSQVAPKLVAYLVAFMGECRVAGII
ncbi:hypothetical protein BHE74_00017251 [Ensete ventricosum]|nr:hypothetical protein BHE74_00017251 [Ensete ventricosum]